MLHPGGHEVEVRRLRRRAGMQSCARCVRGRGPCAAWRCCRRCCHRLWRPRDRCRWCWCWRKRCGAAPESRAEGLRRGDGRHRRPRAPWSSCGRLGCPADLEGFRVSQGLRYKMSMGAEGWRSGQVDGEHPACTGAGLASAGTTMAWVLVRSPLQASGPRARRGSYGRWLAAALWRCVRTRGRLDVYGWGVSRHGRLERAVAVTPPTRRCTGAAGPYAEEAGDGAKGHTQPGALSWR